MLLKSRMICLLLLACGAFVLVHGQTEVDNLITEAPQNLSVGLGNTATISCRGDGLIVWVINNIQVRAQNNADFVAGLSFFPEFGQENFSTAMIEGSIGDRGNNQSVILCRVEKGGVFFGEYDLSEQVIPLVYGLPAAPSDLNVGVVGFSFNLSWVPPFIHQGELVDYSIVVRKSGTNLLVTVTAPESPFLLDQVLVERDCAVYEFTLRAQNDVGLSTSGIFASRAVPTGPSQLLRGQVTGEVLLMGNDAQLTLTFTAPAPCSAYPITGYSIMYRAFADSNDMSVATEQRRSVLFFSSGGAMEALVVGGAEGLRSDRLVKIEITAMNSVTSVVSEELVFYTSGTQSATVTIDNDYVGTVTCNFAPSSTSSGCIVSYYMVDAAMNQTFLFSTNITRSNSTLTGLDFDPVPEGGMIIASVRDIMADGRVGMIVAPSVVTGPFTPTTVPTMATTNPIPDTTETTATGPTSSPMGPGSSPTPLITQETLYIIIGAGAGGIALLVLLIICTVCTICCCTRRRKTDLATVHRQTDDLSSNNAYGGVHLIGANGLAQHKRNNTYISKGDECDLPVVSEAVPAYETIDDAKKAAQRAGASLAPNPIYATAAPAGSQNKLANGSQTNLVDNPVYSDANQNQKPRLAYTDVSALNPIYSGTGNPPQGPVPVPAGSRPPLSPGFPYQSQSPTSPTFVPQPSANGSSTMFQSQSGNQLNRAQSTDVVPPYTDPTYSYAEIRGHPSMRGRNAVSTSSDQEKPGPVKRNESYGLLAPGASPQTTSPPPPTETESLESVSKV